MPQWVRELATPGNLWQAGQTERIHQLSTYTHAVVDTLPSCTHALTHTISEKERMAVISPQKDGLTQRSTLVYPRML